jgi:hypothetical protein
VGCLVRDRRGLSSSIVLSRAHDGRRGTTEMRDARLLPLQSARSAGAFVHLASMEKGSELFWKLYGWFGLARDPGDVLTLFLSGGLVIGVAVLRSSLSGGKVWIAGQAAIVQFSAWATVFLLCVYSLAHFRLWRADVRREDAALHVMAGSPVARAVEGGQALLDMLTAQREALGEHRPSRAEWRDLEGRFGLIGGELQANWIHYEKTGEVVWTVHPVGLQGERQLECFLSEAKVAGRLLRHIPGVPTRFPTVIVPADTADDWLNVVAGLVRPDAHVDSGSGYNSSRGRFTAGEIRNLVEGSTVACARLAAESGELTGV